MKMSIRLILLLLTVFSFVSCSNYTMVQEQKRQKDLLSTAVVKISQRQFTIHVFPIQCKSKNPEVFYISKALADIVANYLKPMMNETVIIPYDYPTNQEIVDMVLSSNSIFSNYVTNMETSSTQYVYEIVTNVVTNVTVETNVTEQTVQKKKNKVYSYVYSTNTNETYKTNISIGSVSSTNQNLLTDSRYRDLINTEFPELTNTLVHVPIVVVKELTMTNLSDGSNNNIIDEVSSNIAGMQLSKISNGNTYKIINDIANFLGIDIKHQYSMTIANYLQNSDHFAFIFGDFSAIQTKNGPNEIQLKLNVLKRIDQLKELKLTLNAREDQISDKAYDFLKAIRQFFLDRPTGDVFLLTDPGDANIYIDGTYIGKSPMYYPAVTAESHQFTFLKPGFSQTTLRADILEGRTNVIHKVITKLKTGGIVDIESEPSNANVFIESSYVGNTPLSVTNLTLDMDHRVKIMNMDTNLNYPDYYHTFRIHNESDTYKIKANLVPNPEFKAFMKETLWWTSMGGWGITIALLGMNIYTHYQAEYYLDYYIMYDSTGDSRANAYLSAYNSYYNLNQTMFTSFVISTMVSLGLTGIMLYNNEVYMGMYMDPGRNNTSAFICFRY